MFQILWKLFQMKNEDGCCMLESIIENTSEYIDSMPKKEIKNIDSFLQASRQQGTCLDYLYFLEVMWS